MILSCGHCFGDAPFPLVPSPSTCSNCSRLQCANHGCALVKRIEGFGYHFDPSDAFILQVEGNKCLGLELQASCFTPKSKGFGQRTPVANCSLCILKPHESTIIQDRKSVQEYCSKICQSSREHLPSRVLRTWELCARRLTNSFSFANLTYNQVLLQQYGIVA